MCELFTESTMSHVMNEEIKRWTTRRKNAFQPLGHYTDFTHRSSSGSTPPIKACQSGIGTRA